MAPRALASRSPMLLKRWKVAMSVLLVEEEEEEEDVFSEEEEEDDAAPVGMLLEKRPVAVADPRMDCPRKAARACCSRCSAAALDFLPPPPPFCCCWACAFFFDAPASAAAAWGALGDAAPLVRGAAVADAASSVVAAPPLRPCGWTHFARACFWFLLPCRKERRGGG